MRYVLDSNVAVAALEGVPAVKARLAQLPAGEVGLPLVAVAELVYGAYRSQRRNENLSKVQRLRATVTVLPLTDAVVDLYGAVRSDLMARGRPKSDFDIIIACTAIAADATLVTHDRALHDGSITQLSVEDWLVP